MQGSKAMGLVAAFALAVLLQPGEAAAQFGMGQKYVGAHVGLSGVGSAAALGLNGEYAYNENIGIGAWLDTWSYGQNFSGLGGGSWNVRYVAVAGTGAYHFPIESNPRVDPFAGVAVGYYVVSSSWEGAGTSARYSGSGNRLFVGGFGGVRYKFQENLSGVARVGFGASYLTVGVMASAFAPSGRRRATPGLDYDPGRHWTLLAQRSNTRRGPGFRSTRRPRLVPRMGIPDGSAFLVE